MGNIGKPRRRIEVLPEQEPSPVSPPVTEPQPSAPEPERNPSPAEPVRTGSAVGSLTQG